MTRRRIIADALLILCGVLDYIPWHADGRWYLHGCMGCTWGLSHYAVNLEKK